MPYREPTVEHMDDMEIIIQSFINVGNTIGGSTRFAFHGIATEIRRLKRVQEKQREATQRKRHEDWAKHEKVHGVKHPDDDIPF